MILNVEEDFFKEEIREGFTVTGTMKRAWAAEMEILEQLKEFFSEHNLTWFAEVGTLLGAVRHKGYVPWDDDLDIGMPRGDYMRMIQILLNNPDALPDPLRMISMYSKDDFYQFHAVVTNNRAEKLFWDEKRVAAYHGCPFIISIDIFPFDDIPADPNLQNLQKLLYSYVFSLAGRLSQGESVSEQELNQWDQYSMQFFGGALNLDRSKPLHIQFCRIADQIAMLGNDKEAEYFDYYPRMVIQEEPHLRSRELYADLEKLPFEMTWVYGPRETGKALEIMYGEDYMTPVMYASEHEYPFYKEQLEFFRLNKMEKEWRNDMKLRIGMIGNGRIAEKFVPECRSVEGMEITCVYNPNKKSAEEFANRHGITLATDKMEIMLPEVDAVYVAVPHEYHYDYAKSMLKAGKHVLCEKPMCLSVAEEEELFDLAESKQLILMEGLKTNYCPGFQEIIKVVKQGGIGQVTDVEAAFTRIQAANTREIWNTECGGSFTEFGSYALLPIVKLLGTKNLQGEIKSVYGETGVDNYTKYIFTKTDDEGHAIAFATAKTGLCVKSEGQLLISGTMGYILVPSPWWLTRTYTICREDPSQNQMKETVFEGAGLRYEIEAFWKRIHGEEVENLLSREESLWMAQQMEHFQNMRRIKRREKAVETTKMNIWAHRGCCYRYPENTLPAFSAAAKLPGLTGIELDIQLTKDGEMVVIHDEKVDATTTAVGAVKDFTLEELQAMQITGRHSDEPVDPSQYDLPLRIPTIREVFELLMPKLQEGLLINIELKNSNERYEGMEQKITDLVKEMGLEKNIIYSSFLPESMGVIRKLKSDANTAILGGISHWCVQKMHEFKANAIHPYTGGMDINIGAHDDYKGIPVRAWNMEEPFYGSKTGKFKDSDMTKYALLGVTDIFTNVPEDYLGQ